MLTLFIMLLRSPLMGQSWFILLWARLASTRCGLFIYNQIVLWSTFTMSHIWSTSLQPYVVYFSKTRCGLFHYEPDLVYFTTTRCGLFHYEPDLVYFTTIRSLWPDVVYFTMNQIWSTSLRSDLYDQIWSISLWARSGLLHYDLMWSISLWVRSCIFHDQTWSISL